MLAVIKIQINKKKKEEEKAEGVIATPLVLLSLFLFFLKTKSDTIM